MKRLIIMMLVIALFMISCKPITQSTSPGALRSILSTVPSELASNNILWFNDMEKMKEMTGEAADADPIEFLKGTTEAEYGRRQDIFAGYSPSDFSGGSFMEYWPDAFGFDAFDTSQEVWGTSLVEQNGARPTFSIMKGNFDNNSIVNKLNSLGYQLQKYSSVDYYSIRADYEVDIKSSGASRMAMANLNRMLVEEKEIVASPADSMFFLILDVRSAKQSSVKDSLAYTRVAGVLGDVLGAALIPISQLRSKNINTKWGSLHDYDLAGIGYRLEGQDAKAIVAIHYPDKSAASDSEELASRMAEYEITIGSLSTPRLSDLFDISAPKVLAYEADSILEIELAYKAGTPKTIWNSLVVSQDLGFLVTNSAK